MEPVAIWPGDQPPVGGAAGELLAGWWCPPGTGTPLRMLPNPWDDRSAVAPAEERVWAACQEILPPLAAQLGEHDLAWWRWVLMPYLILAVSAIEDRLSFLRRAVAAAPGASVVGFNLAPPPASMAEAVARLRSPAHNRGLITALARAMALPTTPAEAADEAIGDRASPSPRPGVLTYARRGPSVILGRAIDRMVDFRVAGSGPAVSVIGHSGLDAGQALALHRRSGARIVTRPNVPKDLPDSPPDAGRRQGLGGAGPPGDGLAALASRVIPDLLPTSVVEGAAHIAPRAEAAYGPPTHLLVGNYSTDELMNGHIAACAAAGRRVDHAQHGGFYLQARVNAQERLEIRDDSTFLAWRSTPNPHLERLRDTHRGGTDVVIVEGLNPPDPYVLRFASTPLGDQGWQSSELLEALVARTGLARSHLRLKRFPPVIPGVRYPPLLAGLPHQMPLGVHSATDWMARARVAVIAYPDTPLVQAIVLGVPVLGLWNPAFWELREDARRPFEELAAAGVLFSDPADAAARLDEVYDHADEWWASSEVAAAREAFIARFAPPGDWLGAWSAHLKGMGAG